MNTAAEQPGSENGDSTIASNRAFMRSICLALLVLVISTSPAAAHKASIDDRKSMSASISNCIHDRDFGCVPNPFKTNSVNIGAAVIVDDYLALADWRSTDGTRSGQVALWTMGCQIWNVGRVSIGRALRQDELLNVIGHSPVKPRSTSRTATELVDELAQVEAQKIAYLRVPPGPSC